MSGGLQRRLYEVERRQGWGDTTFGEECAHLHEEVAEAFREWRLHKDADIRWTCERCGRAVPSDIDLDTVRHPASSHHYTAEGSVFGRGQNCWGRFKPTGVPIELADVVIGCFYNAEAMGFDLMAAIEEKHAYNATRDYVAEGRQLHPRPTDSEPTS